MKGLLLLRRKQRLQWPSGREFQFTIKPSDSPLGLAGLVPQCSPVRPYTADSSLERVFYGERSSQRSLHVGPDNSDSGTDPDGLDPLS